jgi:hypothetical protein
MGPVEPISILFGANMADSTPDTPVAHPPPSSRGAGWRADPQWVAKKELGGHGECYREELLPPYTLPDPLAVPPGPRISTAAQWETTGRPRTLELFREHVYGHSAPAGDVRFEVLGTDPHAMQGRATLKQVKITSTQGGKSFSFPFSLLVPNRRNGPAPAFLLINNRAASVADATRGADDPFWPVETILERGYATGVFRTWDVDPDKDGEEARAGGVRGVFTSPGQPGRDAWGTIGAWAWGASRAMDYLQQDSEIDGGKVAVIGHSRGGKTALWAGAQDERFAMAISNESGCAGAALSRRLLGETVAIINRNLGYWFCGNFHRYSGQEAQLPIDQHQLIALLAPRAVAVGSADEDLWADPRGEFLGLAHASPVYGLYGQPAIDPEEMPPLNRPLNRGRRHYHIRPGGHNLTPLDWGYYMDFADQCWGRGPGKQG